MAKTISCGALTMPTVGLGTWENYIEDPCIRTDFACFDSYFLQCIKISYLRNYRDNDHAQNVYRILAIMPVAVDESEITTALNAALETGYRHIDTAAFYENEGTIGKVLNQWISSGKISRDDLFIVTKLPIQGIHRDRVEKYLTKSLELLGLDYVDLYLIHFPIGISEKEGVVEYEKEDHKGVWESMEKQVEAGRTKTIGLSNFNINQVNKILKFARIKPVCNQVELHVFMQQPELVKFCQKNGMVVTAYSPLGNPGYNKFLKRFGLEERTDLVNVLANPVIADIAKKHNKTNAHVALRFLIQKNIVVIPKSVTPARLKSNFELFDFNLDHSDMKELEQLDIGEEARICDWSDLTQIEEQPEYPFKRK